MNRKVRTFTDVNWDYFRPYVISNRNIVMLPVNATVNETDNSVTHLTDTFIFAIIQSIPLRARNFRYAQRATSKIFLIQERKKLRT